MVFALSKAYLFEVIIGSADQGDVPVVIHSWIHDRDQASMTSQALSGMSMLMGELINRKSSDPRIIDNIQMGTVY